MLNYEATMSVFFRLALNFVGFLQMIFAIIQKEYSGQFSDRSQEDTHYDYKDIYIYICIYYHCIEPITAEEKTGESG